MKNLIPLSAIPQWMIYILAILLSVQCAQAQERFVNALTGAQIVNNEVFTVSDDKFASLPIAGSTTVSVEDRVVLEIDEDALVAKTSSNITVTLSVRLWTGPAASPVTVNETLNLNYSNIASSSTPHRAFRLWSNYHKVEVTITGITYTNTLPPLKLIGEILVNRKYAFATGTPPVPNTVTPTATAANFTWPSTAGAEDYDLEWTFFDAESSVVKNKLALGQTLTQGEIDDIFRFNATRISTANLQYTLPLTYPAGYILYRLRAARINPTGFREYTGWSTYKSFAISTHEPTLNWQAQITFAEEGKMVPTVNYFDNTLRERQSVTLSNSIGMTLASATAYDHQGRPAFKTLTAPTFQTFLKFDPLMAANAAGTAAYGKAEFDINSCTYAPPAMSSTLGVGKYFSPNNPNYLSGENAFIPDAKGFAYTLTEYTADQTGRIRRQSAPGELFRLSGGKETQYFYGKPSQDEIDRLFGNDAGDASHYQKNLVIDPNSQASVSYVDMHGRTVATALAGPWPSNVNDLGGSTTLSNFKYELLNNLKDEYSLTSNYNLLVPAAATYTFDYFLTSPVLNNLACAPGICYDCAYDLRIQVIPSCGGTAALDLTLRNYTPGQSFDNSCATVLGNFSIPAPNRNVSLQPGEYTVIKTLSLNQDALNTYADNYILLNGCAPTLPSLKSQLQAIAYTAGCAEDCSNCASNLLTYYNNGTYTLAEYNELLKDCTERCGNSLSTCDAIKLMLEGDVSPGGQYAQFTYNSITNIIESTDPTSIFYKQNPPTYRYQVLAGGDVYRNAANQPDTVLINGVKTLPNNLTPKQFIENWKPSWATVLAKNFHPEYCYLNWCNGQVGSSTFEANLLATETYQGAVTNGWVTAGAPNFFTSPYPDPFFSTSEGLSCLADLQARWADIDPTSGTLSVVNFVNRQVYGENCGTFGGGGTSVADNDAAWRMFRAIYLSLVAQCKGQKRSTTPQCTNTADLNCIANPNCTTSPYANKERRVINDDYRSIGNDPNYYATQEAAQVQNLNTECGSFCDDNAELWLEQLTAACPSIAALSQPNKDLLKLRLAAVCKASCDPTHPYGATTTPPGVTTSYGDASFEAVVNAFIGVSQVVCSPCHANIISFPGTYTAPAYNSARTVESRVNSCACENYQILKDCYTSNNGGYTTFAAYLKQYSDVPLSASDMTMLETACGTTARNLINPLTLPPYLECGVCKTCTEVNTLVTTFNSSYCTLATQPVNYYTYLARYLNEKLGLNRSAEDYKTFLAQCASAPPSGCRILMLCPEEVNPTLDASGNCTQILLAQADVQAEIAYTELVRAARANFVTQYLSKCLTGLSSEQFYVTAPLLEYQYTLYYYDQSNLLTQTIPPAGVVPLNLDALGGNGQANRLNIRANRANPTGPTAATYPAHTMPTRYAYNSLGGVVKQIAPDHLENRYYYDQVGRLVASQDGRQRPTNKYSYTLYDALGRVTQTGEGVNASTPPATILTTAAFTTWFGTLGSKAHVTRTYYDKTPTAIIAVQPVSFLRENQRSRVAVSTIVANYSSTNDDAYDYATHYSYDITGDVATVLQDIPELAANGHRHKRIDYDYDQLSGKVNAVFYQKGQADQFSYRYFYDLDNRLTQVMSSFTDTEPLGALWDREASYKYYLHGPLARTEIGHYRVQGMDYAYTLQGWIKGLNASFLNTAKDMGKDANNVAGNANRYAAADAFAYTLGFYNAPNSQSGTTNINDYDPIGGSTNRFEVNYTSSGTPVPFHTDGRSQYTGNIRFIAQQTQGISYGATVQAYRYDQLMRLNSMNTYKPDVTALTNWNITTTAGQAAPLQANYKESDITYDRNGNILTYRRWGSDVNVQDSLNYKYAGRNQLIRVTDQVAANAFIGDFDGQTTGNYTYDGAGNLIGDLQGNASITWSPYGKVVEVSRTALASTTFFGYDAMQNRVKKQQSSLSSNISTFYIRDAQGNVLAVYEKNGTTVTWKEQHLYGSSRLGTVEPGVAWTTTPAATPYFRSTRILNYGWKRYEVNDHLGNVRALINDRKTYGGATFAATLLDATDYFPFGAEMRKGTAPTASYRYGFNGKELDKNGEFGSLNHYDYGARIYNPGIGRWLSIDPLANEMPGWSPYTYAFDNPINFVDPDGMYPLPKLVDNLLKLSSPMGMRFHPRKKEMRMHWGQDLSAPMNTTIRSFASGKVVTIGNDPDGWGNYIVIDHGKGYFSLYAHIRPGEGNFSVGVGQTVKDGQKIAEVGSTGTSTGPHLHLEVGQAESASDFISKASREKRLDPVEIGDLEKFLHPWEPTPIVFFPNAEPKKDGISTPDLAKRVDVLIEANRRSLSSKATENYINHIRKNNLKSLPTDDE